MILSVMLERVRVPDLECSGSADKVRIWPFMLWMVGPVRDAGAEAGKLLDGWGVETPELGVDDCAFFLKANRLRSPFEVELVLRFCSTRSSKSLS